MPHVDPGEPDARRRIIDCYLHDVRRQCPAAARPGRRGEQPAAETQAGNPVRDLVEPHLFYVVKVAGEYSSKNIAFEDLLAEGNLGLVEAAHRFDPRRGVQFLTYATWWIRKRILEFLSRESSCVRLTRYAREQRKEVEQAREKLRGTLGREPDLTELATETGLDEKAVTLRSMKEPRVLSLERPADDTGNRLGDLLPDHESRPDPEQRLVDARLRDRVRHEVEKLPPTERWIVCNRFQLTEQTPLTLQEIGNRLGLSRERARQIEQRALARLRRRLRAALDPPG
ncbi:MAG: sigma-70 family RNA polymerase sigma factor [Acidobacteriota bacterium]|nr:sigma-70 family RNA polymerase sigma factor [Acidobacteriota bacterium]MDQ7086921.1 sigma-70 family RNA polymerase sigma factor [Acidobacteriota bacterium]